ncbi:MAG: SDR family NAD(P)-dependent oxidoreductase [Azoarcus sp.]|nr:SDR family NAD(P)-dependent oxidoreductase [Azoarcus sp.]
MISFPRGGLAVVVGASGALGKALADGLEAGGHFDEVIRLGRHTTPALDLLDEESIEQAVKVLSGRPAPLRLVIDATGFLHGEGMQPERSWKHLDPVHLAHSFAINAIGPALLMKHFLPRLARDGKSLFASLSARVGSIGDNRLGGWYGYRASKAALNQLLHTAAVELGRSHPAAVCTALHPGTVESSLSAPFARTGLEVQSPVLAAERLLAVMDTLTAAESGGFFDHRGREIPW